MLGRSGLLSLPYPEQWGGGAQPYEVYLQVLEELGAVWLTVAVGLSVHTMSCYPLATFGTTEQRDRWLPDMLAGDLLGAYALSEPNAGSDAAALTRRAVRDGDDYLVTGTKAWITHGGRRRLLHDDGAHLRRPHARRLVPARGRRPRPA